MPEPKSKKKKSAAQLKEELQALAKPQGSAPPEKPPFRIQQVAGRVALVAVVLWTVAFGMQSWTKSWVPVYLAALVTLLGVGGGFWAVRYFQRTQRLGAILRGADTEEGRKAALEQLQTEFKGDDVQALMARAQLEMADNPRKALETLESIDLARALTPVADQVRSMRAFLHLNLHEPAEARRLVDAMDLSKQQDAKTRAMATTVAGEAWGRTGNAAKGVEALELFNPEDPAYAEFRIQMWRARAFAYAGANDMKNAVRALKKLSELSPQLLLMFVGHKRIHPMLEKEAKALLQKSGAVPRKMVQKRI